jgi:aspartyl-tRNA synthetase
MSNIVPMPSRPVTVLPKLRFELPFNNLRQIIRDSAAIVAANQAVHRAACRAELEGLSPPEQRRAIEQMREQAQIVSTHVNAYRRVSARLRASKTTKFAAKKKPFA